MNYKKNMYTLIGKRLLDIIISLLAIILLLPLLLVISLITYFDVGSPVLFKQLRVGKDGKIFVIYKFRNMTNEKDVTGELLPPESRVTQIGKIIRKTSLDELPQFFNILKGEMSIIGPRPLLPQYLERYTACDMHRHDIRPGLECPFLERPDHPVTWEEQFANDVWYVENCSFMLDIKMFFALIRDVIKPNQYRITGDRGMSYRENEFGEVRGYSKINL